MSSAYFFSVDTLAGGKDRVVRLPLTRIEKNTLASEQKVFVLLSIGSNSLVYKGDFTKRLNTVLVKITWFSEWLTKDNKKNNTTVDFLLSEVTAFHLRCWQSALAFVCLCPFFLSMLKCNTPVTKVQMGSYDHVWLRVKDSCWAFMAYSIAVITACNSVLWLHKKKVFWAY